MLEEIHEEANERPLCANWGIWIGQEVEGENSRGLWTLFIRKNLTQRDLDGFFRQYAEHCFKHGQKITRIWFTKEFVTWQVFRYAKDIANQVALEIEIIEYFPNNKIGRKLPFNLFYGVELYVKVPIKLKRGDHICVGYDFEDEAFRIGDGRKVSPANYRDDIQLA
jgi:hypothetical protein